MRIGALVRLLLLSAWLSAASEWAPCAMRGVVPAGLTSRLGLLSFDLHIPFFCVSMFVSLGFNPPIKAAQQHTTQREL